MLPRGGFVIEALAVRKELCYEAEVAISMIKLHDAEDNTHSS